MPPSIMACATWTPLGPNSRARLWPNARAANLPAAKEPQRAEPLMDAVAPVISREGGCGELETEERSRGSAFWEKL